jgi:aspartate ammonia-lyase
VTDPRTEHDSLGSMEVPAGVRYGIGTARSVACLSFSGRALGDIPPLVRALTAVKVAAARANADAGVIDHSTAAAIEEVCAELAQGSFDDDLVADPLAGGGAIAVHVNINEVIAREVGVDPAVVGASQSTADVIHTAGRLAILDISSDLVGAFEVFVSSLSGAAHRAGDGPTLARTCLQDGLAVPSRLLFDGAVGAAQRSMEALDQALGPLIQVVLGGTVVGTGDGAPLAYREAVVPHLATVVDRPLGAAPDPWSRLQDGSDVVAVADDVARIAGVAAKLARDLRLLSSGPRGGLGEVHLPAVMEGSSFFVGKVNPAVPETVMQATLQIDGLAHVARSAAALAELHLHVFDLTAALAVVDAIDELAGVLHLFAEHCLDGLDVDHERAAELASYAAPTKGAQ